MPLSALLHGLAESSGKSDHQSADLPAFCGEFLTLLGFDVPLVPSAKEEVIDFRQRAQCDLDMSQVNARAKSATPFHEIRGNRPGGSS